MSTAIVSGFCDFSDVLGKPSHSYVVDKRTLARRTLSVQSPLSGNFSQKQQNNHASTLLHKHSPPPSVLQSSARISSASTPQSPIVASQPTLMTPQAAQQVAAAAAAQQHRKLDRSLSEPVQPQQQPSGCRSPTSSAIAAGQAAINAAAAANQGNSSRYKTELCRPFEENGTCKYGDKCQFAHGCHELRTLARHPKYKTELCRTFHTTGFCPYGPRCHFIHNSDENKKTMITHLNPRGSQGQNQGHGGLATRSNSIGGDVVRSNGSEASVRHLTRPKALSIGSFSLGSTGDLSPPSSLSASPTSLNGFFGEDPFYRNNVTNNNQNHRSSQQQQQQHPMTLAQPTTPNTAFSFSQDFAALVAPKTPTAIFGGQSAFRPHLPIFGGSSPSLVPRSNPSLYVGSPQSANDFMADSVSRDPMFKFPEAPPSPADSDLEVLSSSPEPSMQQQHQHARLQNSPSNDNGARLPIFSRLANSDSE